MIGKVVAEKSYYANRDGLLSKSAQIPIEVQRGLERSEEYRKGVKLHGEAGAAQVRNDTALADQLYLQAIALFLKAAAEHPEADISIATFRCGHILMSMVSKPDYENSYVLLKYTTLINPQGATGKMATRFLGDFQQILTPAKRAELDAKTDGLLKAKSVPALSK
jgi:hypothetical protein